MCDETASLPRRSPNAREVPASVEFLNHKLREPLLRFFRKRIEAASEAEDLVQETFARLAKPGRLAEIDNVEAYVFQTAANLLRERGRRRAVRAADAHGPLEDSHADDRAFTPERILSGRQTLERVVLALKELPERTRTIFVLQRFEGLSYVEVARRLGLSQSAVDKHMSRAIEHLAKQIFEDP